MNNSLPWQNIETVLLDMDGTLLDLHFDNYFWQSFLPTRYSQVLGLDEALTFAQLEKKFEDKKGTLDWYCVDYWSNEFQLDIELLKKEVAYKIQFRPHAKDFLQFLADNNIKRAIVTNAHRKSLELKTATCELKQLIPNQFSSHDFSLPKEHPDFWSTFSKAFAFNKETTLFIDDNDSVLDSAHTFGIKYLRSIQWPDSTQTEANQSSYPMIDSFMDIIE